MDAERADTGALGRLSADCRNLLRAVYLDGLAAETVRVRLDPQRAAPQPGAKVWLKVTRANTCYYGSDQRLLVDTFHAPTDKAQA